MCNWVEIRPNSSPTYNYLCFKGAEDGCRWKRRLPYGRWTPWAFFETSTDLVNREDYIMTKWSNYDSPYTWPRITLNKDDVIYIRNKYTSVQQIYGYKFDISWGLLDMIWDAWYLLCKNSTSSIPEYWFREVFNWCSLLQTPPSLPATTLGRYCYELMFAYCTSLTSIPSLPATTLTEDCYNSMFANCSNIKLSTTQSWIYQNSYRIPSTWQWVSGPYSLYSMFLDTWWTFTWTPSINTTYYTSNTVI